MFHIAIKDMRFSKVKYGLIAFILFLIASLVLIVSGLARGLSDQNIAMLVESEATEFYVSTDSENQLDQSGFLIEDLVNDVPTEEGWQPLITHPVRFVHQGKADEKLAATMIPVDRDAKLYPGVIDGEDLTNDASLNIIVDQTMRADGVSLNDTLYDEETELTFTVVGFTEGQTYRHTPVVYVSETAFYAEEISPHQVANTVVIFEENDTLKASIDSVLEEGEWVDKSAVIDAVPGHSSEQMSLNMMIFFLIVISVFVLAAFFYIITIQKLKQFGILKAIGAKNRFLIGSTLMQVVILSVFSLGVAVLFTYSVTFILPEGMPFDFNLGTISMYSGLMFLVSILGALLSSRRIVKVDPQQAMGGAE